MKKYFVFDVESIGLYGEGFAVGYVVVDRLGVVLEENIFSCPTISAVGKEDDRQWVEVNIPKLPITHHTTKEVRKAFWDVLQKWKEQEAIIVADCCYPVETNFLSACVRDNVIDKRWKAPYPLHELATLLMVKGLDPLATSVRFENELPAHNPLNDSRLSARQLIETLNLKQGNKNV